MEKVFKNIPEDLYNIYIHCKYPGKFTDPFFSKFKIKNHAATEWGVIEEATSLLYAEALVDINNKYFIPISESTIPTKSFKFIYSVLFKNTELKHILNIGKKIIMRIIGCFLIFTRKKKSIHCLLKTSNIATIINYIVGIS